MLLYNSLALFLTLSPSLVHGDQMLDQREPATATTASEAEETSPAPAPCTIRSPHSGAFFDLNSLRIPDPSTLSEKARAKNPRDYSWNATGWDMGYNFTMNFCGGVIEDLASMGGVQGVEEKLWRNVSAYYKKDGEIFSIGQQNLHPMIRGRKLVLNYTNGSPCDTPSNRIRSSSSSSSSSLQTDEHGNVQTPRELIDGDQTIRRKSTIISMLCEKDPLMPRLTLSFVGASPDECAYFFDARTSAACAGIEVATQTLSPAGVFGLMLLITGLVYLVGGCVYSRIVLQQRGWRQLPNYALWAGILSFFKDIFVILFSSCARLTPFSSRAGGSSNAYSRMNGAGRSGGRGRDSEAANRLIDELNEEWED